MGDLNSFYRHREYVQCRTFGHAWDDIPVTEPHPDGHSFWLRCTRCGTMRRDVFDRRWGGLVHRKYDYPDNYRLTSEVLPSRDEFRLKLFDITNQLADRRSRRAKKEAS